MTFENDFKVPLFFSLRLLKPLNVTGILAVNVNYYLLAVVDNIYLHSTSKNEISKTFKPFSD